MPTTKTLMTADELLQMPKDGFRYELIEGELKQMSPGGYKHGVTIARFTGRLQVHVEDNNLGEVCGAETGFLKSKNPDTIIAPDVAFISNQRASQITNLDTYSPVAPDLAVEVLSPSDSPKKVQKKVDDWFVFGVIVLILIDPRKRFVRVHRSSTDFFTLYENDILVLDDILPGFSYPISRLFLHEI